MTDFDEDVRQRFLFEHSDIRGEIISLQESYQTVLSNGTYPAPVAHLIGEFLAGVCLLSATLKFDGIISLQASGTGPLSMIMADCTRQHNVRGVAHYRNKQNNETNEASTLASSPTSPPQDKPVQTLTDLLGENATLAVTIDPTKGERYQGIIPVEGGTLSECLTNYFHHSEQLPTRLWVHANGHRAGGLLLQALPRQLQTPEEREEHWHHLSQLANTLKSVEQLNFGHTEQLHRLFHQESLRLFTPTDIRFACSCSRTRTANMLVSLGLEEAQAILEEKSPIEITCQFCHQLYSFDQNDILCLFKQSPPTLH